jgi:hypothetical protein
MLGNRFQWDYMNAKANIEAIRQRVQGEEVSRFRAAAMAGAVGAGAFAAVYRTMRGPAR